MLTKTRRTRTMSGIVHKAQPRKKNLDLIRAKFEPDVTSEDLERRERGLAEQEEAAAVAAFSFPAVPPKSPAEPPVEPPTELELEALLTRGPEPEEEEEAAPAPFVADDQTFMTADNLPPSRPPQPFPKAAREQRRCMREEAARLKKEATERRAEAAAGGFGFEEPQLGQQHPQEFGEFVIAHHGGVGVEWTEGNGTFSNPLRTTGNNPRHRF
ncbi:hypothetical protein FRC01_005028 [Tulasnella sp. 417]|nr:hypothetical protein FRC01_005028 [Tulasnella sp. 417]